MTKTLIILALAFITTSLFGQEILLEQDLETDTLEDKRGPNLKNFSHMYFGYGFVVGPAEATGSEVAYGKSTDFNVGFRYKRRISNLYALGFDLAYGVTSFNLKQQQGKLLPDTILHESEKINFNHFGLMIYNRFNFGKRGNVLGNYIDLAAYGNYEFSVKHIYTERHLKPNAANANITKVVNRQLTYTNPFNYGVQARLGFNRYVFYGSYRLSELFKSEFIYPELPRLIIGLQIGLH